LDSNFIYNIIDSCIAPIKAAASAFAKTPRPMTDSNFWIQKLAAFLHDPPSKALDIRNHWEIARSAYVQADLPDAFIQKYEKSADHTAAAADRLPFPDSQASGLRCRFDGKQNTFLHPLSGERLEFEPLTSAAVAIEGHQTVQPRLTGFRELTEPEEWRARHFAHWRLWKPAAQEKDWRLGFLPADTRIPDHSIWHHMGIVSALAGCTEHTDSGTRLRPAFLKFQLGPVQDFIAAAKSVRDLWSGSYLLSWLMAAGLKALSAEVGPDAVIFPNLHGQPLFDLHWRNDLWEKVSINDASVWDSFGYDEKDRHQNQLLVPNLPNVFLAIVPAASKKDLGKIVADAIQSEWQAIAESSWALCKTNDLTDESLKDRFDRQIRSFLQISWTLDSWPSDLQGALDLASTSLSGDMPIRKAAETVQAVIDMATRQMPKKDRDGRYYTDSTAKEKLNNIGVAWSILVQHVSWKLDAVRQNRAFQAWKDGGWTVNGSNNKDALTGKEEAVGGGSKWQSRCEHVLQGEWKTLFKTSDPIGAITLLKRVWHLAYLRDKWNLRTGHGHQFPMPNTHGIAAGKPLDDGNDDVSDFPDSSEKHFAVLALDGDQIGRWVSGEKTPLFEKILANYSDETGARAGAVPYFERTDFNAVGPHTKDFLKERRPLSPGFHLQFSEALSNFALHCAKPIVEAFQGRLIYAGGDDVLAMLPANRALKCAAALRDAFQGRSVEVASLTQKAPGFLQGQKRDDRGEPIPFVVPGEEAECSVGIAIAHFKSPLQDVVRAAQAAEKRAKNQLGRRAVAISIFKRSGEITEWGCQWKDGGLALFHEIASLLEAENLSKKFPHRVCQLLEIYLTSRTGIAKQHGSFDAETAIQIIEKEFQFAVRRQSEAGSEHSNRDALDEKLAFYLRELIKQISEKDDHGASAPQTLLQSMIGLCTTAAFAHRTRPVQAAPLNPSERR
jgi:hypothetical protein